MRQGRRPARPDRGTAARRRRSARRGAAHRLRVVDLTAVASPRPVGGGDRRATRRPGRHGAGARPPAPGSRCGSRPGDDAGAARDALVRHLEAHAPWGAQVRVTAGGLSRRSRPAPRDRRTPPPARRSPRRGVLAPVEIGVGGSIGFVGPFAEAFPAAEVLITGVEDPDTRAHAANESLHLGEFERACLAEALLLQQPRAVRCEPASLKPPISRPRRGTAAASATRWPSRARTPGPRSPRDSARPCLPERQPSPRTRRCPPRRLRPRPG